MSDSYANQKRTGAVHSRAARTIATLNFKGGVGKTTVTWCLADVISQHTQNKVLVFDLDAQMSLTQAVTLNEDSGALDGHFSQWYERAIQRKKTIFDALDQFTRRSARFDFGVGLDFVYAAREQLHFVPSVEDLYWMELDVFDREGVKDFVRRLMGKICNSPQLPQYDYVLFDCPPSFTLLSYSVLACCDLILIPVNPDFFAAKGTNLILNTLRMRIEPHPLPRIAVFMNKAKANQGSLRNETASYIRDVRRVCSDAAKREGIEAHFLEAWIPERVGIKRAITAGEVPPDLAEPFKRLWNEVTQWLG